MGKLRTMLMRHRRILGPAALVLAVIAIFWVVNSPAVVGVSTSAKELPIYCVQRSDKAVSLTFDAAWGNEDTQTLIDILNRYGVKATFFLVGQWVDKYPESVKALADAGMEIGNHSDTHPHMSELSEKQIIDEVSLCSGKIQEITGGEVKLFRCPYGEYDDEVITTLRGMGLYPIQWDVDSLDWKDLEADEITKRITSNVSPGSVVLFHNAGKHTPEALPGIIEYLLSEGYSIVPVSELLLSGQYDVDNTGRMIADTGA